MALRSFCIWKGTNPKSHASNEVQPSCLQILLSSMVFTATLRQLRKCSHWQEFLLNLISTRSPTESRPLNMSRFRGQYAFFLAIHSLWQTGCVHGSLAQECNGVFVGESLRPRFSGKRGMLKPASFLEKWFCPFIDWAKSFSLPALKYSCCSLLSLLLLLKLVRFCMARSTCIQDTCVHLHWRSVRTHSFLSYPQSLARS